MNIHSHIHSHSQHCTQCWWIFMCMWAKADVEIAWQSSEQSRYSQKCLRNFTGGNLHGHHTQRTHGAMKTSLLRQNDVTTSFWRNNDVIITPRVRWDGCMKCVDNVNTDSIMNYDEPYPENERGMNEFNAFDYTFDLFFNTWCQISNMLMVCWKCVKRAFLNDYFLRCSRDTTCWQFRSPVRENRDSSWLIPTFSSLLTPEVVITTTSGVASDEKVDIMMILFV